MFGGCGRKLVMMVIGVASATAVFAQTPEDEDYRRIDRTLMEDYLPRIEADTAIFYRAVQSADDIFAEVADYNLSFVAFSRRGGRFYKSKSVFDGIPVRNEYRQILDNLQIDCRRFAGNGHSESFVGGAYGFKEYISTLAEPPSTGLVGVNFADRGYWAGLKASVSETFRKGWVLSAFLSGRTGRDMHVEGVFTNAVDAGLRLSKHWNYRHRLTVVAMCSPSERGLRRASVEEAFTLTGDNLYNPSWGMYNGMIRNANVRRTVVPTVVAAFDSELSARTTLTISAGVDAGMVKYSALEWFDALTPIPDNYRFLPSNYSDFNMADGVAGMWRNNDVRYTQIDWDELYRQNRMSPDGKAVYAVGDRVEQIRDFNLRASAVTYAGGGVVLGYGANVSYKNNRNWRQMRDMLGADYIVDIDQFLVDDATYGNRLQNDLQHPNRIISEGDRFGYDYALENRYAGLFVTMGYQSARSHIDFAAEIGDETIYRHGFYEKELFAGAESFGRSRNAHFMPYTIKAAYGFSFTPQHYLELRASLAGETPDADDLFLQTQYNNRLIDNPTLRSVGSAELNYTFLHKIVDLRLSLFALLTGKDCEVSHYFDDLSTEYADMVVSEISRLYYGAELAANIRITKHWNASLAFTAGQYGYYSDPRVTLYSDSDNRVLLDNAVAHMGDCKVGNAPQLAGTADVSYMNKGWGVRMAFNYAGLRYVEPVAMRRTDRVSRQSSMSEEMFLKFVTQERLPDAATVDAMVWKVFWLKRDYNSRSRIVISLSARNLLGNKDVVYNARESARIHRARVAGSYRYWPFATTYLYSYPRTFRLSVSFRF